MIGLSSFILTIFIIGIAWVNGFKRKTKLPPGPFRWPIIGNIIEMNWRNATYPHLALAGMAKKYGEVMSLGFGVHYSVVVSSYTAIKEIFKLPETTLGRFEFPFVPDRAFNKNLGIIWSNGSAWREIRRFTMRSLRDFGLGKAAVMESVMEVEMAEIVQHIKSCIGKHDGVLQMDSHVFAASSINILWSLVGGFRFPLDDEKLKKGIRMNDDIAGIFGHSNVYSVFPFLKTWLPKWSQYENHVAINQNLQSFIREIIEKITIKRSHRKDKVAQNLVESFLDQIENSLENPESYYTEEQLVVVLMDLFFGGSETTSTALSWAVVFLVLNPEVQRKVQREISKVSKPGSSFPIAHIGMLPYLKATIFEVFRMANFVPIPVPRRAEADFAFKNYVIPKGTALLFNLENVMNDENHWGDPQVFRPERFLDPTGEKLVNTERVTVFGFGRRICIGESLAWDTLSMFLITLLRNFNFEAIPGSEPSIQNPCTGLTLSPKKYSVKVQSRG